jgi:phage tail-like protein
MSATPFTKDLGTTQGRVAPASLSPPEGAHLLVLGSEVAGRTEVLANGDKITASQSAVFGVGVNLLRYWLRLRGPSSMPAGSTWWFAARADGVDFPLVEVEVGRERTLTGCAANLVGLASPALVEFELLFYTTSPDPVEVELPAVMVDALIEDATTTKMVLINRLPDDGETEVPVGSHIELDIADLSGGAPVVAGTAVYVTVGGAAEVLAYNGGSGGFQVGWDGAASAVSMPSAATLRIVIDRTTSLPSLALIGVRVLTVSSSGSKLEDSYSFTVQDLTAPRLVSAMATGRRTVKVSFDESVLGSDPAVLGDALNPANWSLVTSAVPAVQVAVDEVSVISGYEYLLTTDIDLTQGAVYQVTVEAVTDLRGNVVAAPYDQATFTALACQRATGRDFDLLRLLPKMNVREDDSGDLRAFVGVLQEVVNELLCDVDAWIDIIDLDLAPEAFVDAMLADLANPFAFADELTLIDKRRLLAVLVEIYRAKGTAEGIIDAVRFFLGIEVEIREALGVSLWVLGESELGEETLPGEGGVGQSYTFHIYAPNILSDEERERIEDIAHFMRPAHTHLGGIFDATPVPSPFVWSLGEGLLGLDTILS